jgi:two-component system sensor histidine kinase QseC
MRVEPFAAVVLDLGLPGLSGAPVLHRYGRRVMFQVWKAGTVLSLHSQPTPNTPLSPIRDGFSDATIGGARWRVFSTWDVRDRVLVQVAEHVYERDELATAVARNFVVPLAIALPVLGVVIWAAVGRAMRSLTHVDQQVASRAADNLTALDVADAPSEIGALVTSLNALFGRICRLIEQERHFTADAAHELRTPLAGIRAQAQVAQGATDGAERARALDGVMAGCDRATHAVEQMLTLARLAPDAVSFQPTSVELGAVLKATIGELAPIAIAKHMDIALDDGRDAFVSGDAGLLAMLFRNVIDNAIRYSAPGTMVDVDLEVTASDVRVTVSDAGPGISAEQRANVGRRFYRAPGTQAPGSGLGLSIVQRILDLHRGTIRLDSPATTLGLQVTIALPRVAG